MVVAERSRDRIGDEVPVRVSSVLTTANGRMVFGQPIHPDPPLASAQRTGPRPGSSTGPTAAGVRGGQSS
jgi:hypothetical protein